MFCEVTQKCSANAIYSMSWFCIKNLAKRTDVNFGTQTTSNVEGSLPVVYKNVPSRNCYWVKRVFHSNASTRTIEQITLVCSILVSVRLKQILSTIYPPNGLHTTVYNKGIKLAKTPRRSPLTVTDERVTYNCVQQGNKVGQNTARSPLTVTDERVTYKCVQQGNKVTKPPRRSPLTVTDEVTYNCVQQGNKVGQNTAPEPAHSYGRHTTTVYNKGIKFTKPPRRSPLTVTDERVTYNCVQQGNKVGQNTAPEPAHSYGRE
ncbi:hypothetical protein J6590_095025, partial [Homalodisca vitripennis]